jgi:acetoin utilization protein AcuB
MQAKRLVVRQVMTPQVISVSKTDTMELVEKLFQKHNIHHIPVLDSDNKLIGLVSKSDYLRMLHGQTLFRTVKVDEYNKVMMKTTLVKDIMVEDVVAIEPDQPVSEALQLFRKNLFRALPVVSEGKLIGILTPYDLMSEFPFPKMS